MHKCVYLQTKQCIYYQDNCTGCDELNSEAEGCIFGYLLQENKGDCPFGNDQTAEEKCQSYFSTDKYPEFTKETEV